MFNLIIFFGFIFIVSMILMFLNLVLSKKEFLDREKISPFECGFLSLSSSRLPFSINFYLIGILFLIFDVEVVFLFPLVNLMNFLILFDWMLISYFLLMILMFGLEFEKKEGSLKWIF